MKKFLNYLKEVQRELKQVTWPTKQETIRFTMIVVGFSLVTAIFLGTADYIFAKIIGAFLGINL